MYICFTFSLCTPLQFLTRTFQHFCFCCLDFYECMLPAAAVISFFQKNVEMHTVSLSKLLRIWKWTTFSYRFPCQLSSTFTSALSLGAANYRNVVHCMSKHSVPQTLVKSKSLKCFHRMCTLFCSTLFLVCALTTKTSGKHMLLQDSKVRAKLLQNLKCIINNVFP